MHRTALIAIAFASAAILSCSGSPIAPRPGSVTVSGRITDRDGPPLADAFVYFVSDAVGQAYDYTDSDGRYSMRLTEGVYRMAVGPGSPGGYPVAQLHGIVVGSSGATVDYRYEGVRVSGSVVGPSGELLTAATVGAYRAGGGVYVNVTASTVAGRYSLLIPAGVYGFSASSAAYEQGVPRLSSTNVPVASDTTLEFALTGFTVTATLTLEGATPMIGAGVSASSDGATAGARTGLDGVATLYLPAGNYTIRASAFPNNVVGPQSITKSINANDALSFDFSGPEWSMTIRRASDDTPITTASVQLDDGEDGSAITSTDAFGRCTFVVRPGTGYTLLVGWPEGGGYRSATVSNLFSAADTTFDISVSDPAFP